MNRLPTHCIYLRDAKPNNFYVDYASVDYIVFRYVLKIDTDLEKIWKDYLEVDEIRFKVLKSKYVGKFEGSDFDKPRQTTTRERIYQIVKIPNTLPINAMKNAINVIFEMPGRFIE